MNDKKIEAMHKRFGTLPDKRCEDCSNLIKGKYHDKLLRKCTVYGATHSEASDWRMKYVACGLFNVEYHGSPIIRCTDRASKTKEIAQQIDGQISIGGINESTT